MNCNNNKKFKKVKSKNFKKKRYSAAERRAYYIGLGRNARTVTGSGKELESFKRGLEKNALKIELSKY